MENICIYYNEKSDQIIDILPATLDPEIRSRIENAWDHHIMRRILLFLSDKESSTAPKIKESIGHSMSTLHENINRLESLGLIRTEMIYSGNKQRIIKPVVLCVTRNPKHKEKIARFFQGLWIDSNKTSKIIAFLKKNNQDFFTAEEISLKTRIPVDEVELLLGNFDSVSTKGLSNFWKKSPFEKKVLYRGKK